VLVRVFCGLLLCACGSPLAPPSGSTASGVSFEPNADGSAVPSVVRVHVKSSSLTPGAVALFQGQLSSYYLGRIKSGALPDSLAARQVPIVSWRANGELIVAPTRSLISDTYSLAASTGLVTEFRVAVPVPTLARLWPPAWSVAVPGPAIYCGDGSSPLTLEPVSFEPGGASVAAAAGADDSGSFTDRCMHFDARGALESGQIVVPQPTWAGWALDPAPFAAPDVDAAAESDAAPAPAVERVCSESEVTLGFGCATSEDDRIIVRTPATALLWAVNTAHGSLLEVTNGNPFVVRGLTPESSEHLSGTVYDVAGAALAFDRDFTTSGARERPVLNEELANPLGPEPQSEWLEVVNDGTITLDLAHFSLRDGGGSAALPTAALAPGTYALLVRDDFTLNSLDVPPPADARLIRLSALGTSGLSNSGEPLSLVDASGNTVSALPAVATASGQSLRRRHTYSPDDDASAFSTGTPTPGAPNQ